MVQSNSKMLSGVNSILFLRTLFDRNESVFVIVKNCSVFTADMNTENVYILFAVKSERLKYHLY